MEINEAQASHAEGLQGVPEHDVVSMPTVKLLLTLDEAAHALGIHKTFLYTRLLEPGHIFSVKLGTRRLVPLHALHEYVERLIALQKAS